MNFRSDGGVGSAYRPPGVPLVPPHKIHKVVRLISAKMPPQMADKSPFTTLTQTGGRVHLIWCPSLPTSFHSASFIKSIGDECVIQLRWLQETWRQKRL